MRSPRLDRELDERERALALERGPVGDGALAVAFDNRHALRVPRLAPDQRLERAGARLGRAVQDGEVGLAHGRVVFEVAPERAHRAGSLREHHHAARLLVETVHHTRTLHAAHAAHGGTMREERVHERAVGMAGRGMHDHPRRLVDDENIIILKENLN